MRFLFGRAFHAELMDGNHQCTHLSAQRSSEKYCPLAETLSKTVIIQNFRGLHARASAKFCAVASAWDADVRVSKDDMTVGGCSIMGLLLLSAGKGSRIEISASGVQAQEALDTLIRLVEERFGEES